MLVVGDNGLLDSGNERVPKSTPEGLAKDAVRNLHKDLQEGAFEFELNSALEVSLELNMQLDLLVSH